jgi:homocysteine S-methyltransferase
VLRERPDAVSAAHRAFFCAGAHVATTAGYQVSGLSLERAGADPGLAAGLLRLGVEVAARARDEVRPAGLVAGSVGPYGASLADGSEYTGDYGLGDHAETVWPRSRPSRSSCGRWPCRRGCR